MSPSVLKSATILETAMAETFATVTATPPIALHVDRMPDSIDRLPEGGRDKLVKLRLRSSDLNKLIPKWDDVHPAAMARVEAQQRLDRLREHPGRRDSFGLADSDPRTIAAAKRVEELAEAEKRLTELQAVRSATWREASHTLSNVEAWLKSGIPGGTALQDFETPEPRLNRNEDLLAAIERHRQRCQYLRAGLKDIRASPYPSEHCKQQARTEIEALAARGEIGVRRLVEHNGSLDWPMAALRVSVHGAPGATGFTDQVDTAALLAWIHRDAILARVYAEIDAVAQDGKAALSVEVREQRDGEISAELLAAERALCSLIWRAQSAGLPAEFASDLDPVAILGVEVVTMPAVASSGTTPGLSWAHR